MAAGLMALLSGCMPSSQGPADEQKESFYLKGKALEGALDFKGAIAAYEKALEVNPQSGSAHFELGLLSEKENDYAAAIYHFDRYLKLRPDSERMQIVQDRIMQNKMELAKTTTFAPVTQNLQKQFDTLAEESRQLRAENEKLRADLATLQARPVVRETPPPQTRTPPPDSTDSGPGGVVVRRTNPGTVAEPRPAPRVHTVKSGDTPSSIARKYNVKLEALMTLNPSLDPRRMQVGQTVKIPNS